MPRLRRRCHTDRDAERLAELSLLQQAAAIPSLACGPAENECGVRHGRASDVFLSSGEGI
jgi:hypothetical protein